MKRATILTIFIVCFFCGTSQATICHPKTTTVNPLESALNGSPDHHYFEYRHDTPWNSPASMQPESNFSDATPHGRTVSRHARFHPAAMDLVHLDDTFKDLRQNTIFQGMTRFWQVESNSLDAPLMTCQNYDQNYNWIEAVGLKNLLQPAPLEAGNRAFRGSWDHYFGSAKMHDRQRLDLMDLRFAMHYGGEIKALKRLAWKALLQGHTNANYWKIMIDQAHAQDPSQQPMATPIPGSLILMGSAMAGLLLRPKKQHRQKTEDA